MTKKKLATWGKVILIVCFTLGGLAAASWLLVSAIQLALAVAITVSSIVLFPVFYELLLYGQFTAMLAIWKGNPVYALQRNKKDYQEELGLRRDKVTLLGRSVYQTIMLLQDKEEQYPELFAQQMPMALKQRQAYDQQLKALERADKIVNDYDEIIDRAQAQFDINQSLMNSAGALNALGGKRHEMRELRERVAKQELDLGTARAMAELDMLLTGSSDMKQTSAGKALEAEKARMMIEPEKDTPQQLALESEKFKEKSGNLFDVFNKERK